VLAFEDWCALRFEPARIGCGLYVFTLNFERELARITKCVHTVLNTSHGIRGINRVKIPDSIKPSGDEEERLLADLDAQRLPQHIAVIMDGNGRWAQRRHLPRIAGHRAGVQSARTVIETCARLNIPALTLYAFSMENWRRPKAEIDFLMRLLREYLRKELPSIHRNNIRMLVIGRSDQLSAEVRADIDRAFLMGRAGLARVVQSRL